MVATLLSRPSPILSASATHWNRNLFAGAGAAGLALALIGVVGRGIASRRKKAAATDWDQSLADEHHSALKLFDKLSRTRKSHGARRRLLLGRLKQMLDRHALQEENAVYPALRDAGLGDQADELTRDHGHVRQYLYDLARMTGDPAAFRSRLAAFRSDIARHMRAEEQRLFPRLKRGLTPEQNGELTEQVRRERMKLH